MDDNNRQFLSIDPVFRRNFVEVRLESFRDACRVQHPLELFEKLEEEALTIDDDDDDNNDVRRFFSSVVQSVFVLRIRSYDVERDDEQHVELVGSKFEKRENLLVVQTHRENKTLRLRKTFLYCRCVCSVVKNRSE